MAHKVSSNLPVLCPFLIIALEKKERNAEKKHNLSLILKNARIKKIIKQDNGDYF